jgi:tetratricopeptide (TPR) repeat protein
VLGCCLTCEARRLTQLVQREVVVLGLLLFLTGVAFVATRAVARRSEAMRREQAAAWFTAAEHAARRADTVAAVAGLRRAVAKDPDSRRYRLALAKALVTGGRTREAERVLLTLRQAEPEDPEANLSLARLEAREPDTDAARRYYQYALAALWQPEHADERQDVRLELIDFLLSRGERARALSELLLVATHLPAEPGINVRVGRMFLGAGDARQALEHFQRALRTIPAHPDALAGAGEAAFALGDYTRALRYLDRAPDDSTHLNSLRQTARLVVNLDPLAPRLAAGERVRRLRILLEHAAERLVACEPDRPSLHLAREVATLREALERRRAADRRDLIDEGLAVAFRAESGAEQNCAMPQTLHGRAVTLIARRHRVGDQ